MITRPHLALGPVEEAAMFLLWHPQIDGRACDSGCVGLGTATPMFTATSAKVSDVPL